MESHRSLKFTSVAATYQMFLKALSTIAIERLDAEVPFAYFFITNCFGVVAAAIQSEVDCEDYISHLIVLPPLCTGAYESLRLCAVLWASDRTKSSTAWASRPGFFSMV